MTLARRLIAELLGTALLLTMVVGSGMMGERLAGGNVALSLLANSLTTGCILLALILSFAPISGAHFNPLVSLANVYLGNMRWRELTPYVLMQTGGAFAGVAAAHLMFDAPLFSAAQQVRTGAPLWWSEFLASFGLLGVIIACSRSRPNIMPIAVAAYITAACWCTASSSFANPALTLARAASDTFVGIRASDVGGFVLAQMLGAGCASALFAWLYQAPNQSQKNKKE